MWSRTRWAALSLLFIFPLVTTWHAQGIPLWFPLMSGTILVTSLVRPMWGLLILAGLLPLSAVLQLGVIPFYSFGRYVLTGDLSRIPGPFTPAETAELMLVPFLCAASARFALTDRREASRLARPAVVLGAIVGIGGIVGLIAEQQSTAWPAEYLSRLYTHWMDSYFGDSSVFLPLHSAIQWIEALTLAVVAERLFRTNLPWQPAVVRMLVAGAAGQAALSWNRLAELHLHGTAGLRDVLLHTRFNPVLDSNAAGSLYAIFFVLSFWIALRQRRWWAGLTVVLLAFALWVTHSRTGQAAVIVGLGLAWIVEQRPSRRQIGVGLAAATALLLGLMVLSPITRAQSSAGTSILVRLQMTRVGLQMAADHPIFGVGLNNFRRASLTYITPDLKEKFPQTRVGENAHNNFVQVLADLGIVGLVGFGWLLVVAGRGVTAATVAGHRHPAFVGLVGGIGAFLASCIGGHPLLLAEVLFLFFLALGVAVGFSPPPAAPTHRGRWLGAGCVAILAVSVPIRLWDFERHAELDHRFLGAGDVVRGEGDRDYRLADAQSRWFVTSAVKQVEIPLRATAESSSPCQVHIDLDGQSANTIRVLNNEWTSAALTFDHTRSAPATRRIDFRVETAGCRLKVASRFTYRQ